uniref:Centrosomal protein of 44 kDa n=1 Tax=Cyprinus carpio carpio TaxID=630221 RepID=A0A9J8BR35_CYPCA
MSTGDLKACLRKLEAALRSLKYPREVDYQRLAVGDPSACLPIVSFAFTSFSPSLTEHLVDYGMELTGMNDLRFIENVYKVLREVFSYKPLLTKQQFLQFGFAERKVIILSDIIGLVLNKHKELTKDSKECVLESRLRGVEASLLESVGRLEQRLALMEHRIHALEKSFAGKIIIESNQWENMESRVLLLETRLALTSAQGLTSGDDVLSTDNGRFKEDTVSASGISTVIQPPSAISNNGHTPASSPPTAHQNFKERLDRIVYMMEDTSNILQNRTDDVNLITVQRNVF